MVFRQSPDVIARPEGSNTLVFHQKTGRFCILNRTSAFLWQQCNGEQTSEQIGELLSNRFEVPETANPDGLTSLVDRHLGLLHKAQLLEAVTA